MTRARILADYVAGGTTAAEFDYMDGVTSNVQTQLDAKLALAGGTMTGDLVSATPMSHRNIVINGAMQISQRGTSEASISGTSTGYKNAPDRFWFGSRATGTWTVSQSTEAPAGFGASYKIDNTTADASLDANSYLQLSTRFEGQDLQHLEYGTSGAKTTTLSFYVRSNLTGTFIVELEGTESTNRHIAKTYTISSANTWERKEVTFAGDTTVASDNNNGGALSIIWWLASGTDYTSGTLASSWQNMDSADRAVGISNNLGSSTSNDFHITGIQWEVGSSATPFEHRSYGDELARCQRYYQYYPESNTAQMSMKSGGSSTGRALGTMWWPVTMRANPTIVVRDGAGTAARATYHANNVGQGGTNDLTLYYVSAFYTHMIVVTDSYTGYDFYVRDVTCNSEL